VPGNDRLWPACDIAGDERQRRSMSWPARPCCKAWLGPRQPVAARPRPWAPAMEVAMAAALYGGAVGRRKVRGGPAHAGDGVETFWLGRRKAQQQGADGSKLIARRPWRMCSGLRIHVLLARRGASTSAGRSGRASKSGSAFAPYEERVGHMA
jgi:hypothetical protein